MTLLSAFKTFSFLPRILSLHLMSARTIATRAPSSVKLPTTVTHLPWSQWMHLVTAQKPVQPVKATWTVLLSGTFASSTANKRRRKICLFAVSVSPKQGDNRRERRQQTKKNGL